MVEIQNVSTNRRMGEKNNSIYYNNIWLAEWSNFIE